MRPYAWCLLVTAWTGVLIAAALSGVPAADAQPAVPGVGPAKAPAKIGPPPARAPGAPVNVPRPPEPTEAELTPAERARRDTPIAKVGDTTIKLGEFERRINSQTPGLVAQYTDPARRVQFLETMIRDELLAQEARRRNYDREPAVRNSIERTLVGAFTRREFDERITAESIPQEEVQTYYQAHFNDYNKPELVRAYWILVAERARAEDILRQAKEPDADGRRFRQLAQQNSEDAATKVYGGDLRFFPLPENRTPTDPPVEPEVARAAFATKNVAPQTVLGNLVKTQRGWAIIKFANRRPPMRNGVEKVQDTIRAILWRERREKTFNEFLTKLRQDRQVQTFDERLNWLVIESPPPSGGSPFGPQGPGGPMPMGPGGRPVPMGPGGRPMPMGPGGPMPGGPHGPRPMPAPGAPPAGPMSTPP